jgi:hypothetical protein
MDSFLARDFAIATLRERSANVVPPLYGKLRNAMTVIISLKNKNWDAPVEKVLIML